MIALSGCTNTESVTPNPDLPSGYLYTDPDSVIPLEKNIESISSRVRFRDVFDPIKIGANTNSSDLKNWQCKYSGEKIEIINYFTSRLLQRDAYSCGNYYIIRESHLSFGLKFYGPFGDFPTCAIAGQEFSKVFTDEYPGLCCKGFTEWDSGFDTRISVAGSCYETGALAGNPVGTCISCGNGICNTSESVCNCPQDCSGGEASDFETVSQFCENSSIVSECKNNPEISNLEICNLCN